MASPQFLHLLEQIHKTSGHKKLPWRPVTHPGYLIKGAFRVALGDGVVRLEAESEDEFQFKASYNAYLLTREGLVVDEICATQHYESEHYAFLRELYQSARAAAFNLDRMIDGMQDDLESGQVRDLPPDDESDDSDIPF